MSELTRRAFLGAGALASVGVVASTSRVAETAVAVADRKPPSTELGEGGGFREYGADDSEAILLVDHLETEGFRERQDLSSTREQYGFSTLEEWSSARVASGVYFHPDGRQATVTAILSAESPYSSRAAEAHVWTFPAADLDDAQLEVLYIDASGLVDRR